MFNLYFAGSLNKSMDEHIVEKKACRLQSFANDRKGIEWYCKYNFPDSRGPLLVDSGAFSVAHSGITVDIDEYIRYINQNKQIEYFIELDVIPFPVLNKETAKVSAEKSWENYLYMIERLDEPFKLLPVFHFGEDLNYLKQMLNFTYKGKHIPYICIGGRHGVSIELQEQYFETVFRTIEESSNPNVKIHILGMTVIDTLEKFPFHSADSTSYLLTAAYGGIRTPYGIVNVSGKNKNKDNFRYLPKPVQDAVLEIINSKGYNIEQLASSSEARMCFNIDFFLEWAKNYRYKGPQSFSGKQKLF